MFVICILWVRIINLLLKWERVGIVTFACHVHKKENLQSPEERDWFLYSLNVGHEGLRTFILKVIGLLLFSLQVASWSGISSICVYWPLTASHVWEEEWLIWLFRENPGQKGRSGAFPPAPVSYSLSLSLYLPSSLFSSLPSPLLFTSLPRNCWLNQSVPSPSVCLSSISGESQKREYPTFFNTTRDLVLWWIKETHWAIYKGSHWVSFLCKHILLPRIGKWWLSRTLHL